MAVFTLDTDYPNPTSKSVKIDGKQIDKVRQIFLPQLRRTICQTRIIQHITRIGRKLRLYCDCGQ